MNSSMMLLALFATGLGVGYSIERAEQGAPLVSFTPRRDPVWLRDLDPAYQDLASVMKKKGFTIDENATICKQLDIVGYYYWGHRTIKICTDSIAKLNGDPSAFRLLLQQTLAHEAVHVAQSCRQRLSGKPSLELAASRLYSLPPSVRSDIQKSIASNRTNHPRSVQWRIEAEAWAMEDTPDQVIAALQRFCR
ncbi:hypothetical protein KBY57_10215 [Cyanobium sp. Aljojuca 7D2]|uniref:hypothetical protein n=1 Tax=Cyanobium sp. Aljojuca 7D2 TaxID=2823698 RepID=UPI0020CBE5AB|nr:hypothetical protein [Cyanobium sp. Aljojuca 7D2]MCP9891426.1 hypothetical protein [Cyanobium sp. Aljojuca 7D2]